MNVDKIVYEVIEAVNAVSDDRHVDKRLVQHKIDSVRADVLRKQLSAKTHYSNQGVTQKVQIDLSSQDRSVLPSLPLGCKILKSVEPIPKLISENVLGNYFNVTSVDVLRNDIEMIDPERARTIHFEFPVVYAFLGTDYHVYVIAYNNEQALRTAVIEGIFESPFEVDPTLTEYPLKSSDWEAIKPIIVQQIINRPPDDPLNNSEPDYAQRQESK